MVRLGRIRSKTPPPAQHNEPPIIMNGPVPSRGYSLNRTTTNDNMSYITDVSSVTCPIELARSNSLETAGDADVSYFSMTEVNSALTGWTSVDNQSRPAALQKEVIDKGGGKLAPINEPKSSVDELSVIMDSSDDGSVEVQSITGKLKSMNAENWNPRPMSINASKGNKTPKTPASPRPPLPPSPKTTVTNKAVKFQSPSDANASKDKSFFKETIDNHTDQKEKEKPTSQKSSPVPPSPTSSISSTQKKRQPVPPLKDPSMDDNENDEAGMWEADCNYDINPTVMFQVLESGDWRDCIEFLDGKSSDGDVWNFAFLTKGMGGGKNKPDVNQMKARQKELRSQARTWIVRRERKSGVLRWRMLPIHAALVFNAPFDVVLRLYHLYPGAVRCRNDLGMLPLHHVFMYGNEDRILELFLDVFPEGLGVKDDKGRLPLGCTPQDGSENERRSNILDLYSKFQVEFATRLLEEAKGGSSGSNKAKNGEAMTRSGYIPKHGQTTNTHQQRQPMKPLQRTNISSSIQPPIQSPDPVASLGIAPRYTTTTGFNHVPYEAMRAAKDPTAAVRPIKASRLEIDDDKSLTGIDKYASMSDESENSSSLANLHNERAHLRSELLKLGGLDTIQEDGEEGKGGVGVKKMKKGFKKLFKRGTLALI
ncbi:hypothetical protein ACHAWO_013507 [Cyclotella atomus]|uniref:Ankyrin repeat protein n=1 Tax=Cyclotella atomus TaxID=382360 RepID=A0ABD3PDB8_9STRA